MATNDNYRVFDIGVEAKPDRRILVVDDEEQVKTLVVESLEGEYNVITASNGSEALRQAKNTRPDLIIMDVMMPDMGGFETVHQLQADDSTSKIPVLIFSAQDFDKSTIDMIRQERNVVGFIHKPFRPKSLRETVRIAIEKKL